MRRARTVFALCGLFVFALVSSPLPGTADEPVLCIGELPTISGTEEADIITGTPERDVIIGLGGDDVIYGYGGDDVICGFDGDDILIGGTGNDSLFGGRGADQIHGGRGADDIHGDDGPDELRGGGHNDQIQGGAGADMIFGRTGNDTMHGGTGYDKIRGQAGEDVANGSVGNDRCTAEFEVNCEIAKVGERIDVFMGPEVLDFPVGTPFHIWHGWACNPAEIDCALPGVETVLFQLFFDDAEAIFDGVELTTIVDEWRQKIWVFNFPEGMEGTYTIRGLWTEDGTPSFGRDVIVTFS